MKLPGWLVALGYLGLLPFLAGPFVLTFGPPPAPDWLDGVWINYVVLVAVFLAGSLWGFGLVMISQGGSAAGVWVASALMLLVWMSTWLSLRNTLYALVVVFALSLLADLWRERAMGPFPGYFRLRAILTFGALGALVWRLFI